MANTFLLDKRLLIRQIKMPTENPHLAIPVKAGIQYLQARIWIPALRYAAAGMTNLLAGLIKSRFLDARHLTIIGLCDLFAGYEK